MNDPTTFTSFSTSRVSNNSEYLQHNRIRKGILMGFKITTPDGLQYEYGMFNGSYDPNYLTDVEFSADIFNQFYFGDYHTAWYLKKITASNREFVEFFYERGHAILQLGETFSFYKAEGQSSKGFLGFNFAAPSAYTQEAKRELHGRFTSPMYLSKIKSNSTIIDFNRSETTELQFNYDKIAGQILDVSRFYDRNYYCLLPGRPMLLTKREKIEGNFSPGLTEVSTNHYEIVRHDGIFEGLDFNKLKWFKLDNISITSRTDNSLIGEWLFKYNNEASERLKLLSLEERGKNGMSLPPYEFKYDTSKTLPEYNSFLVDHWGYYNGRFAEVITSDESSLKNYKGLREPVEEFLYPGSLVQVITPMGGSKIFKYEPNRYNRVVKRNVTTGAFYVENLIEETKMGGGLRIKEVIEKYEEGTPEITHRYTYTNGVLLGDIQYYWPNHKAKLLNGSEYTSTRFVTESFLPLSQNPEGGEVSYEEVKHEQVGKGWSIYEFTNFLSNSDEAGLSIDAEKSPYSPFTSRGFERGLLNAVRNYEKANSANAISSQVFKYKVNPAFDDDFIRAVEAKGTTLFGADEINSIEGTAYKHYLHPYQIENKTISVLDKSSGTYYITKEEYDYDIDPVPYNDNNLKEVRKISSTGEVVKIRYTHPKDYSVENGDPVLTGLNSLINNQLFDIVVSEEKSVKPMNEAEFSIIKYTLNTFKKTSQEFPVLKDFYDLKISEPVTSHTTQIGPTSFNKDPKMSLEGSFDKYDEFGNPLQYTGKDGVSIAMLYGYGRAYPVAKIRNCLYNDVLNILGQTVIDELNNAPGSDDEIRLKLLPLRSSSLLEESEIITYSYSPLVGMTSQTDPNGNTFYYEYDDFGRLTGVKDQEGNIVKANHYNYKVR